MIGLLIGQNTDFIRNRNIFVLDIAGHFFSDCFISFAFNNECLRQIRGHPEQQTLFTDTSSLVAIFNI